MEHHIQGAVVSSYCHWALNDDSYHIRSLGFYVGVVSVGGACQDTADQRVCVSLDRNATVVLPCLWGTMVWRVCMST